MLPPLRDIDVRQAVHRRLLAHARADADTLVVDELGLLHGAARVDIAVINGHIRGLEIKAEADTLARLPQQILAYGQVVDRATLIAADKHIDAAIDRLPDWWGVVRASRTANGSVKLSRVRAERANRAVDPISLARLLWHSEAAELLRLTGCEDRLLRAPRATLYAALATSLSKRDLSTAVRTALKNRANWRDQKLPL